MKNLNNEQLNKSEQHLGKTKEPLKKLSKNTGEAFGAIASDIAATSSDYVNKGKAYMSKHPSKSLAISAAAGAVVGGLFTLALKRRK